MSQPTQFHKAVIAHGRNQQINLIYQMHSAAITAVEQQVAALPFNGAGFRFLAIAMAGAHHATDESDPLMAITYYHAMRIAKDMACKLNCPITYKDLGIDY